MKKTICCAYTITVIFVLLIMNRLNMTSKFEALKSTHYSIMTKNHMIFSQYLKLG